MSFTRLLSLLAPAVLVVAACTSSAASPSPIGGGTSSNAGVIVGSASSPSLGTVLTGPNGMTLYTHAGDTATSSTCTGGCATTWPPLETKGQPTARAGVTGQLGTLTRPDGATQVTVSRPAALLLAGRHEGRRRDRQRCRGLLDRDGQWVRSGAQRLRGCAGSELGRQVRVLRLEPPRTRNGPGSTSRGRSIPGKARHLWDGGLFGQPSRESIYTNDDDT